MRLGGPLPTSASVSSNPYSAHLGMTRNDRGPVTHWGHLDPEYPKYGLTNAQKGQELRYSASSLQSRSVRVGPDSGGFYGNSGGRPSACYIAGPLPASQMPDIDVERADSTAVGTEFKRLLENPTQKQELALEKVVAASEEEANTAELLYDRVRRRRRADPDERRTRADVELDLDAPDIVDVPSLEQLQSRLQEIEPALRGSPFAWEVVEGIDDGDGEGPGALARYVRITDEEGNVVIARERDGYPDHELGGPEGRRGYEYCRSYHNGPLDWALSDTEFNLLTWLEQEPDLDKRIDELSKAVEEDAKKIQ